MKKFIAIIITIITALSFAIGLAGCNKVEYPKITAEEPAYDYYFWKNKTIYKFKIPTGGSGFKYDATQHEYEEFLKFYFGEYKSLSDEVHYIFNPALTYMHRSPHTRNFQLFYDEAEDGSDKMTGVYIYEWVRVYQKGLDKSYDRKKIKAYGESKWTAKFEFILPAVDEDYGIVDNLEFGVSDVDRYDYFINVYAQKVCISTVYCEFRNKKKIPVSWVEQYIRNNLYYGG